MIYAQFDEAGLKLPEKGRDPTRFCKQSSFPDSNWVGLNCKRSCACLDL